MRDAINYSYTKIWYNIKKHFIFDTILFFTFIGAFFIGLGRIINQLEKIIGKGIEM